MSLSNTFLYPRRVAVVGASDDPAKTTARPLIYLRRAGFAGTIYPVNARRRTVLGEQAWGSIAELPETPDHVFVLSRTEEVVEIIEECVSLGVPLVTVLAGGFGEIGPLGRERESRLREVLAGSATRLLGPNSIGIVNVHNGLMLTANAAFGEADLPKGGLFVGSHSGSMIGAILSRGKARGVGFAGFVSTGAEVDLNVGEICGATLDDLNIDAYALFLESIRHGAALRRFAVAAADRGKPIVAYKLGRSEQAAELSQSHTGAIAGEDGISDAFLKDCGIARVDTLEGLIEAPALLRRLGRRWPARSPHVAVVSTTGGGAALVVDQLGVRGVEVHAPTPTTMKKLAERDVQAAHGRIVDLTLAGTRPETMRASLEAVLDDPEIDLVIAVAGSSARSHPQLLVPSIVSAATSSAKPLVAFVAPEAPEALAQLNAAGLPSFRTPESCADVIAAAYARRAPRPVIAETFLGVEQQLDEAESYVRLRELGISSAPHAVIDSRACASPLRYPVALKLLSSQVLHKSELGGVALGVKSDSEFVEAAARIRDSVSRTLPTLKVRRLLVQEMVHGAGEVLLSFRRDADAGPLLMLAAGGIFAELYKDRSLRQAPVDREQAQAMIAEVKTLEALNGYRGRRRGDLEALCDAMVALSHAGPDIIEAEVNPLLIGYEGSGVTALDAVVRTGEIHA